MEPCLSEGQPPNSSICFCRFFQFINRYRGKTRLPIVASILGIAHYALGVVLVFYGWVTEPALIHKVDSAVGILLLLPFSLVVFIPALDQAGIDIAAGLMSFVFWIFVYFRLLKRIWGRNIQ